MFPKRTVPKKMFPQTSHYREDDDRPQAPGGNTRASRSLRLLVAALGAFAPLSAADWPVWLGPNGDNSSSETGWLKDWGDTGPPRLFEKSIGEGYSAIAVARGHLILFHREGKALLVDSLDPSSGERQWRFRYQTDYVDRYGYNGGPRCSPVVDTDASAARVYTLGPKGVLHALELATGKKAWSHDLPREFELEPNFFGVGAAPVLYGDRLFVNLGGTDRGTGFTFALEKSSGRLVWKSRTGGGAYAAGRVAEIDGARQLFIYHRLGVSCFDPESGDEKWVFPWRSRIYDSVNATTPVVSGDIVFVSAAYRTGSAALRVKKGSFEVLWQDDPAAREKIMESHWSNVNLVGGHLYGFSGRHESEARLTCVELESGKVRWRWGSYLGRGSMLYSDGHFIALGERGDLALLRLSPRGHEEVERLERVLRYPAWTPPTLAGGRLYLRDESRLICMDLRARKLRRVSGMTSEKTDAEAKETDS